MNAKVTASPALSRLTEAYILMMLAVFPLFTGFAGYEKITLHKYLFFAGASLLWLLGLLTLKIMGRDSSRREKLGLIGLFLLIYLILCLVSGLFSPFGLSVILGEGRFDGLLTILLCLLIFFGVSRYAKPRAAHLYAAAGGAVLSCAAAILQLLGKNPLGLFPGDYFYYDAGTKFSAVFLGTIGNADLFSAHLCLVFPLLSVYYCKAAKRPLWLLPALLPLSFCLFACKVSAGLLALGATALLTAPVLINSGESLRRFLELAAVTALSALPVVSLKPLAAERPVSFIFSPAGLFWALALLLLLLLLLRLILHRSSFSPMRLQAFFGLLSAAAATGGLAFAYFFGGQAGGSLFELHELLHGRADDSFGSSRFLIWRKSLALFPQRPLLGGGAGTLPLRLDIRFSRFVEETGKTLSTFVDNAHNDYLSILINSGLPALLSYLFAQAASLIQSVRQGGAFIHALASALLCYWISAFFGLGLFLVSPLMWLFWGLLSSALHRDA